MKLNTTEKALVTLWKIAGHTQDGCVAIMEALNEIVDDPLYDTEMVLDAKLVAFGRCQQFQIKEASEAWVGELKETDHGC